MTRSWERLLLRQIGSASKMAVEETPGLQFGISEFRDELRVLGQIAAPFLAPGGESVLADLQRQIDGLWHASAGSLVRLEIHDGWPLDTIPSEGAHDHAGGSRFNSLWCRVTVLWTVAPLGLPVKNPSGRRAFRIAGGASTVIELFVNPNEHAESGSTGVPVKVASWRMEIGNIDDEGGASPGPLFHVQVPEWHNEVELGLWPHWLSIPRLHSMPFTPMAAIEFALSEVFQERWAAHVESPGLSRSSLQQWAHIQRLRFTAFLRWQEGVISSSTEATPIVALKRSAPPSAVFIS